LSKTPNPRKKPQKKSKFFQNREILLMPKAPFPGENLFDALMRQKIKEEYMKKVFAVLVLTAIIAGGLFAQEKPKNWVYGQVGLIGGGAGYERFLFPSLSIGGEVYFNSFFILWNSLAVEAYAKYYPLKGKVFYAKLGLGFGTVTGTEDYTYNNVTYGSQLYSTKGFLLDPGVGWKIDVGEPGKFYIEPKAGLAIVMGKKDFGYDDAIFKVGVNPVFAFAMGYAF
jgi:hypothetical protein